MSGIPVFSAGTSLQSSGASVSAQIPADSAGMLPLFVRVTATAAGYFRLSQDGASAAVGDLLVQPSDGLILKTCGLSQFSFVSQSGASTVTVTPIDVGGIKYPTNIFTPAALFTPGVNGAWYDPSDYTTLYQDAAGTAPVTAVGQPVGLMLDKSKGLVLGPELNTGVVFALGAGWTNNGGGSFTATSSSDYIALTCATGLTTGKTYRVTANLTNYSGGTIRIGLDSAYSPYVTPSNGVMSWTFSAGGANSEDLILWGSSFTGTLDNISVRELLGNHAFNPSGNSANFPVLQQDGTGRYYLSFNGVNQWLRTNSIDFTYGDKMFVSAGVRKLSDASVGVVTELSVSAGGGTSGTFVLHGQTSPVGYRYAAGSGASGAAFATDDASVFTAPITNVVSGISDFAGVTIADEISVRVNGAAPTQTRAGTVSTGNFGNYPLYLGARAGSSLWFNGHLYGLVVAGKQASASEIASTEAWLNQKTGAY